MKFLCENLNTIFDQKKQILGQTNVYSERNKSSIVVEYLHIETIFQH